MIFRFRSTVYRFRLIIFLRFRDTNDFVNMSSNSPAAAIADLPQVIVKMHFLVFVKFSVQLKR